MLVAVLALPVILFAVRAIIIIGRERSKLPKTATAEMLIALPWMFAMLMGFCGIMFSFFESLSADSDGRYELTNFIVQAIIGIFGQYYLPVMALTALICGIVNIVKKKKRQGMWDIIFAAVFMGMCVLCLTGDVYSLMTLFDGED
ncbi:MAG: hypothetical protein BWZ04_02747 [Firmicutes bacterium ADurb.BinA205]|nr:MAG: hypothetical protein BWZ04_02747 [Firmicutes bacterium ADurb.BinA205]HOC32628.1 hypothetical protein [Ruminococcus flavefaciens]HQL99398.1 hypothetical protein [Ruminococcus flavefaciens]